MASISQYSIGLASLSSKKSFNSNTLSVTQSLNSATNHIISNQESCSSRPTGFQLSLNEKKKLQPTIFSNIVGIRKQINKDRIDQWKVLGSDDGSCGIAPMPLPPSVLQAVEDFYKTLNAKDTKKLEHLLADDCQYQDLVFYIPFEGKQAVVPFLGKVMDAMGPNIHFVIDAATEGGHLTATVFWHLEWKHNYIPFTTGCTLLEYEQVDRDLLLRKVTGMEELPFKPGDLVLKLLKSASTFFDLYPRAAEALLLKSHGSGPHEGLDALLDKLRGKH